MRDRLRAWGRDLLPPLLWTAIILSLSSNSFSGETTGRMLDGVLQALWPALLQRLSEAQLKILNVGVRKLAHLTEYAVLAFLWSRARRRGKGRCGSGVALYALTLAALTAVVDETHQSFCAARVGAPTDVLLDCCGAVVGTIGYRVWIRRRDKCPISASLS